MQDAFVYRTKLTQVKGDLKATVIAKHLSSGLAVVSQPLNSEAEAKAQAAAKLAQNLSNATEQATTNRANTNRKGAS